MCEVHLWKKNVSCETCGKSFEIERQYGYKYEDKVFCCYKCYNQYLTKLDNKFKEKHKKDYIKRKVERIKGMVYEGRPWGIKEKTL